MLSVSLTLESITIAESQIIRALSGVSTVAAGLVGRPDKLAIVPQHPLVPTTPLSLLDFVIYPRQLEPKDEAATIAEMLDPLMRRLGLSYLAERDGGWHAVHNWEKVLSMGEQQSLGIIRALVHRPRFALLDACTSAMAEDVACEALRIFQERGIAYVSVSQSEALEQFHTQKLRLGEPSADGWSLAPIVSEAVEEQGQGDEGS